MKRPAAPLAAALVLAAAAVACGGASTTSNVVAPSSPVVTETFSGTVPLLGQDVHTFNVTSPGSLNVTLVSTSPQTTLTMGLGVGNPGTGGICSFLSGGTIQTSAGSTAQLSGSLSAAGAYCVAVGDVGNAAGPITYTVTVAHT